MRQRGSNILGSDGRARGVRERRATLDPRSGRERTRSTTSFISIREYSPVSADARRACCHIRADHAYRQEEAAERCGMHRTYYSGIERGVRNVSLVNIEKVGKGLRTSLAKLFERI